VAGDRRRLLIRNDHDVVDARAHGRSMAAELGFSRTDLTLIATAISEVGRNIVTYAEKGEITIMAVSDRDREGLAVIAKDEGPGIDDLSLALRDGYSTHQGLGLGLPGTRRLMDDFEISSTPGKGTTIRMAKWRPRRD
jgi:serine/threonine-protein kinase RsbT